MRDTTQPLDSRLYLVFLKPLLITTALSSFDYLVQHHSSKNCSWNAAC